MNSSNVAPKKSLNSHVVGHNQDGGENCCYFCKKRFAQRPHLFQHMMTHTQKPYFCVVASCQYSCTHATSLKCHTRIHHSPEGRAESKTWTCYFCHKTPDQVLEPCGSPQDSYFGETISLWLLQIKIQKGSEFENSHFIPHHGETISLRRMSKMPPC